MQTLNIVRTEQIHKTAVHRIRVVVVLPEQKISQFVGILSAEGKVDDRSPKRIVHYRVERVAQSVVTHFSVAFLSDCVFPDFADDNAVGIFGFCRISYHAQNLVGKLVGNIYPPAGGPELQPAANYTILTDYYIVLPVCVLLVYFR